MKDGDYVRLRSHAKRFLFPMSGHRSRGLRISDAEASYALNAVHSIVSISRSPQHAIINFELGGRTMRLHVHKSYLVPISPLEVLALAVEDQDDAT